VLKACLQISGLTLRIHGESGIPEGSYQFWQTLFEAISGAGRVVEIDMHAKGLNQEMIDMAHKTGMPVKAGAKFWAEHQGLGYRQADIRETEYPRQGVTGTLLSPVASATSLAMAIATSTGRTRILRFSTVSGQARRGICSGAILL
jgi:hypothetical protein